MLIRMETAFLEMLPLVTRASIAFVAANCGNWKLFSGKLAPCIVIRKATLRPCSATITDAGVLTLPTVWSLHALFTVICSST